MTIHEARLIGHIKTTGICTYRALAEIFYPKGHELWGVQWAGEDLCREAAALMNMNWEEFDNPEGIDKHWGWHNNE
jgi:hypothetical protein